MPALAEVAEVLVWAEPAADSLAEVVPEGSAEGSEVFALEASVGGVVASAATAEEPSVFVLVGSVALRSTAHPLPPCPRTTLPITLVAGARGPTPSSSATWVSSITRPGYLLVADGLF